MTEPVEQRDMREALNSQNGKIERVEDGFKIITYDPARAPKAVDTIRAWFGPRKRYGPYAT